MNKKTTRELIRYMLCGCVTTFVNIVSYKLFYYSLGLSNIVSTILSWALSVLAAYLTNKKWVFCCEGEGAFRKGVKFFALRSATGILDVIIMFVGVDLLAFSGFWIKILSNVIVIILNYVFSKLYIFDKD